MNALVNVARYHLADRFSMTAFPWSVTAFAFGINLVIFAVVPTPEGGAYTYALCSLYCFMFVLGLLSVTRSLPFGMALGISRRAYYLGTGVLVLGMGVVYGLAIAVLQVVERALGGWGVQMHFFRLPWLLDGSWYLTWLTAGVLVVLTFAYGMWFGLVFRRWDVIGLVAFIAVQVVVATAAALVVTWTHTWPSVGDFFATLSVAGLTGVLALVAAALATGGYATMRRVAV